MLTNLAFLALICSGSVFCAAWLKRTSEEILPITAMGMVCLVFVFGVLGFLKAGVIACLAVAAVLYVLCGVHLIFKRQLRDFLRHLVTPGFVVFVLLFLGLSLLNYGRLASSWDEFSHWVDIVKVMATVDDFGTNPASHSAFQSYPPGMSIFQYIFQKLTVWFNRANTFSEWRVYVAYQVFSLIPMLPLLKKCSFRRPLHLVLTCVALFLTPLIFYQGLYNTVYIDPYLGLVSGAGLLLVLLREKNDWVYHGLIWLYCAMLVLAKDVGVMFALFLAAAYMLDLWIGRNGAPYYSWTQKALLSCGAVLAVAVPKMLWNWEIKTSGAAINFSNKIDFSILVDVLLGRDTSYRKTVLQNYMGAQFDNGVTLGDTPLVINFFALTVLFLLLMYLLYRMLVKKMPEKKRTVLIVLYVTASQMIAYILGLCVIYMFKFSQYEAVNLASMSRYLNMVFLAAWLVILGTCCDSLCRWGCPRTTQVCLLCAMLIVTPMKNVSNLLNRSSIVYSTTLRAPYERLNALIHKHCDGNDKIYYISQDDNGFNYWIARFNARPSAFNPNFTWAIGESEYQGGMYTQSKTAEQWQQELVDDYDYVAIYKLNGYFTEHYRELFENPDDIGVNALYKVDKATGLLVRCE